MAGKPKDIRIRFWKYVSKGTEESCWEWQGARHPSGYGVTSIMGRSITAHRMSYELHHGEIPSGLCVLHHCDNPPCVNPSHLFLGTFKDNSQDMVKKRRQGFQQHPASRPRGERNRNAKLSNALVAEMRSLYLEGVRQVELVKRFSVSKSQVSKIVTRQSWRDE